MKIVPWSLLLVTVAACASTAVSVDRDETVDFAAYRTFRWSSPDRSEDAPPPPSTLFDRRARREVERVLAEKGYRSSEDPDLLVTARLDTDEVREVTSWNHGFWWRRGGFVTVRDREEGRVVLDVVDARRNALVWRGVTPIPLGATGAAAPDVAAAVEALLSRFPTRS